MAYKNVGYDHVGVESITFIPYLVVIPIAVYGNVKLYTKHKSAMFVCKRNLSILFGLNISLLIGILASIIFHVDAYYLSQINGFNLIIYFPTIWLILFFLITKNWSIFFQYKWQYYSLQISWQQIINKKIADIKTKSNWFIRNKKRWGNSSFFAKRFAVFAIFGSLCWVLVRVTKLPFFIILGLASILITAIMYMVIVCKTPYYNDIFYIHYESKIHAKLLLFAVLIIITMLIIIATVDEETFGQPNKFFAGLLLPFTCIIWGLMVYVSTFVIMKKNLNSKIQNLHNNLMDLDAAKMEEYSIELILADEKGINLFMNHLAKEYSMECLLSYIEFCQYQKYLIENDVDNVIEAETKNSVKLIDFPENIPLSEIIEDKEEAKKEDDYKLYEYKMKAYKIFKKYVDVNAEFAINISWSLRSECIHLINNLDQFLKFNVSMNDLVLLFEDSKKEMKMLLVFSLSRFKKTDQFEEVIKIFDGVQSTDSVLQRAEMTIVSESI